MVDPLRNRIASLCGQLSRFPEHARIIDEAGAGAELAALLTVLGTPDPDASLLAGLLDTIDDVCTRYGLPDAASRGEAFGYPPLPPGIGAAPGRYWVCPRGACDRVLFADEAGPTAPECAAAGPMAAFQDSR